MGGCGCLHYADAALLVCEGYGFCIDGNEIPEFNQLYNFRQEH